MRILNLYAGIGGNRKLWGDSHNITAVENDAQIAKIYSDYFPKDTVIIGDAHEYLQEYYKDFDFIWSSPPCQSHSSIRQNLDVKNRGTKPIYPDLRLYEEIIFCQSNVQCHFVVENVKPYYKPLIEAQCIQRHLFWSDIRFNFDASLIIGDNIRSAQIEELQAKYNYDLKGYKLKNKRQVLRNCLDPFLGRLILDSFVF